MTAERPVAHVVGARSDVEAVAVLAAFHRAGVLQLLIQREPLEPISRTGARRPRARIAALDSSRHPAGYP